MTDQDFLAPVRFEPSGPARRPFPRWIWLAALVVAVAAGVALLIPRLISSVNLAKLRADLPPTTVYVGQPLAWRQLDRGWIGIKPARNTRGGLFAADFDADGDDELLSIRVDEKSRLYEVDGRCRLVKLRGLEFMLGGVCWDLERDGVAEIVVNPLIEGPAEAPAGPDQSNQHQGLPVYNLDGKLVGMLPAPREDASAVLQAGDLTGDGFDELIATGHSSRGLRGFSSTVVFGANGAEIWKEDNSKWPLGGVMGDVDADGKAECLRAYAKDKLVAFGIGQPQAMLTGWQSGAPRFCMDITGDNRDEVICPSLGFLSPSSGKLVEFKFPEGIKRKDAKSNGICCCGDFTGDGLFEIPVARRAKSWLIIFEETGRCSHYEELGDPLLSMVSLRACEQDYLALQLAGRLLIYP